MPPKTSRARLMLRWALPAAVCLWAVPAAAQVTVTPASRGYDIDIESQITATDLVDAISAATGATVRGQPKDATINPNHLRGTSLERALRLLLPQAAFTLSFGADGKPIAIIFLAPQDQEAPLSDQSDDQFAPVDTPAVDASSPDLAAPDPAGIDPAGNDPQTAQ